MIRLSSHAKDISGLKVGRLKALWPAKRVKVKSGAVAIKWMCGCDCGRMAVVWVSDLLRANGPSTSCGCFNKEHAQRMGRDTKKHGRAGTHLYEVWRSMLARCRVDHHAAYESYGGRGIEICDRWMTGDGARSGLECFAADMGERPNTSASIERRDNDGSYSPDNCYWASPQQQTQNRRVTVVITAFGRTGPLSSFIGFSDKKTYNRIAQRIRRGMKPEFALAGCRVLDG